MICWSRQRKGIRRIRGVSVAGGAHYLAPAVLLTTGTFLRALMHTGEAKTAGGRGRGGHHQRNQRSFGSPRISYQSF